MVVPDGESAGDVLGEAAEMLAHALADRFERLEAGGARCGVDADALDRAMVDGDEHRRRTLAGDGRSQVRTPHRVDRLRDDGPVVAARATRRSDPRRGAFGMSAATKSTPAFSSPSRK